MMADLDHDAKRIENMMNIGLTTAKAPSANKNIIKEKP
jgi:hypothetical protein